MIKYEEALERAKKYPMKLECCYKTNESFIFAYKGKMNTPYLEVFDVEEEWLNNANEEDYNRIENSELFKTYI